MVLDFKVNTSEFVGRQAHFLFIPTFYTHFSSLLKAALQTLIPLYLLKNELL